MKKRGVGLLDLAPEGIVFVVVVVIAVIFFKWTAVWSVIAGFVGMVIFWFIKNYMKKRG